MTPTSTSAKPAFRLCARGGFTLVELMIALALSSIVIGAAFALFINSNRVYQATTQTGRVQQEARAALDIMAFELQMAGFGTQDPQTVAAMPETSNELTLAKDAEMAFTRETIDSNLGPDVLQYQANLGGVAILNATYASGTLPDTGIEINVNQGVDGLSKGMNLIFTDSQRNRLGTAIFEDFTQDHPTNPTLITISISGKNVLGDIRAGSLVMKAPKFITYMLSNGRLMRCARDRGGPCDPTLNMNLLPDPVNRNPDPETTYALADHVEDMQFSYLLEGTNTFAPAPAATDFTGRLAIRAVKIELLVVSSDENPTYSDTPDCATLSSKGGVQTEFRLGNHTLQLPFPQCRRTHTAISTVVRLPNMYSSQGGT